MKKISKIILITILCVFIYSAVNAQSSNAYFIIHKTNNKIFSVNEVNGDKTAMFEIAGLNSKEEAEALVEKIRTLRGVVSISMEPTSDTGTWEATAVFYKYADKKYFPQFFNWCGIETVEIDNIKYDTQNIEISE